MPSLTRHLEERTLILLSNREPYEHRSTDGAIEVRQPPGGLVSALDPTMQATHGVWVAWGSGNADRRTSDEHGRVQVPPAPGDPAYTLHRVFLTEEEIDGYYLGFANRSLWPLCHMLVQHFEYRGDQWERYRSVNLKFAEAVAEEIARAQQRAVVWIQDYHFGLAAEMIRAINPPLLLHQFWHIPFPPVDILSFLPTGVHDALLRGMLGNDLIGFQTERYALNFLGCVAELIPDADIDADTLRIYYQGRTVEIAPFPISIDVEHYEQLASAGAAADLAQRLRDRYTGNGCQLGLGVDRLDYTKGIPERLRALRQLWQQNPELRQKFTFLLVATPSRSDLPAYRALEEEMLSLVVQINDRFRTETWTPIVLIHENISSEVLAGVFRAADICLVSSLQDGMNLVAKEFVACQVEERGVLVLSRFTGAAEEIDGAILINPFNIDGFVAGIRRALEMGEAERRVRMHRMRAQLRARTIFDWLEAILSRVGALIAAREQGQAPVS
ncbi:MAG TPA: trehalose-6-phosphate synthase [Gemmatimonadaceae bacterium]|nr:trehalose-6-phosphate synthase [Gemmatimonadaceae bacterium]